MRNELRDPNGQPLRLFRATRDNNVEKAIDQLSGICAGILADGVVNKSEAAFFAEWVSQFEPYGPVWPFTDILARIRTIFADGVCDENEREELKAFMQAICGRGDDSVPEESYSSALPLDSPPPDPVVHEDMIFTVTGKFAFGTRAKVFGAIGAHGGIAVDSGPTRETSYLVVGAFASRDWATSTYGRKIEKAVKLRDSGSGILILSEEHWRRFVE